MRWKGQRVTSKRDGLVTRRELAALLKVHMMTVTKWERDGMPVAERGRKGKPSKYRAADVRGWLAAREKAASTGGVADVARERARKERAQAVLAEQLAASRSRELLPRDEVKRAWEGIVTAVRTKLLAAPRSYSDRLVRAFTLEGAVGHERVFGEVMREICRELATGGAHEAVPTSKARNGRAA